MEFDQSPNYRKGRRGKAITHIVIHATDGWYEGTRSWFKNPKSQVSAHYLISKTGEAVQMCLEENAAWHCGLANNFTIGIELEDASWSKPDPKTGEKKRLNCNSDTNWYTIKQLTVAAALCADIMKRRNIPISHIVGHDGELMRQYKSTHSDPGKFFKWSMFLDMVKKEYDKLHVN